MGEDFEMILTLDEKSPPTPKELRGGQRTDSETSACSHMTY